MLSKMVSIVMMWFLFKKIHIFEIYLSFWHFLPKNADVIKNFGHKFFLGKVLESSYDCLPLVSVSAS